jgi:drug/metabolite transporter (DMT)-like permease
VQRRHGLDATAMAVMLVLCAIWGLTQVSIKIANGGMSPLMQAGLRSAGSALLLWGWSRARGVPLFQRDGTLGQGTLVAVLFAAEFVLIYWGLTYTTASR